MIFKAFTKYINNFRGFSKEIWILTLMTFINRSGTMVLPFLSKYLKEDLHFSYSQVGNILFCSGIGSLIGSWLGGKLTDKVGFYKVMIFSLASTGIGFFILQGIKSYLGLCLGMFSIMVIADMFRPAMFVSLGTYASKKNRTKALTLVRLAINLGFAAGPAMGGLIIISMGYQGIFWIDSFTCILAILIFWFFVKEKKNSDSTITDKIRETVKHSVFKDRIFSIFLISCLLTAILFFQLFYTFPLYQKEKFNFTEAETGLLMMMNGLIIFLLEMPIVNYIERKKISKLKVIILGASLIAISMFSLLLNFWVGSLTIMILLMTFGEMFFFPFTNSFAMSRAKKGSEGRYMAIFTMSFSGAQIISSELGLQILEFFKPDPAIIKLTHNPTQYQANWLIMGCIGILSVITFLYVKRLFKKENKLKSLKNS